MKRFLPPDARLLSVVVAGGLAAVLTACAQPGTGPAQSRETVTVELSARAVDSPQTPVHAVPAPGFGRPCDADSARLAPPKVATRPSGARRGRTAPGAPGPTLAAPGTGATPRPLPTSSVDDSELRRRMVLERAASATPIPRREAVPDAAAARADQCVRSLQLDLRLLTRGTDKPSAEEVRSALTGAGLTRLIVRDDIDGPVFAGWTGQACVYGEFHAAAASLSIGMPAKDGACQP